MITKNKLFIVFVYCFVLGIYIYFFFVGFGLFWSYFVFVLFLFFASGLRVGKVGRQSTNVYI